MKILGLIGSFGYRPDYIAEINHDDMQKLVGDRVDLGRLTSGSRVAIHDLWHRYHELQRKITAAGTDAPRNLRALADLLEAQIAPVVLPEPEKTND